MKGVDVDSMHLKHHGHLEKRAEMADGVLV